MKWQLQVTTMTSTTRTNLYRIVGFKMSRHETLKSMRTRSKRIIFPNTISHIEKNQINDGHEPTTTTELQGWDFGRTEE